MRKVAGIRGLTICALLALAGGVTGAAAEETPGTAASPAAGQTAPANVAAEPAPGSPQEVVCKKEEAATGTMLGRKKICKTRKEWDDLRRESQAALQDSQDKALRSNAVTPAAGN
ncbi:MAG: hypothetical protein K8S25_00740 [Alphaproteobacteria bacterium]|nr:hypothetical protein [Alphaproteobacteria bacterium]